MSLLLFFLLVLYIIKSDIIFIDGSLPGGINTDWAFYTDFYRPKCYGYSSTGINTWTPDGAAPNCPLTVASLFDKDINTIGSTGPTQPRYGVLYRIPIYYNTANSPNQFFQVQNITITFSTELSTTVTQRLRVYDIILDNYQIFHYINDASRFDITQNGNNYTTIIDLSNILLLTDFRSSQEGNVELSFRYPITNNITVTSIQIYINTYVTKAPTLAPTISTSLPTKYPSKTPTKVPTTNSPTIFPTGLPTLQPSQTPTIDYYDQKTTENITIIYSPNLRPLSERMHNKTTTNLQGDVIAWELVPMTYSTFTLEDGGAYDISAILAWGDIDAKIELIGCDNYNTSIGLNRTSGPLPHNSSFYFCDNGLWKLTSSARLVQFQKTYGRIEIWEVEEQTVIRKHLHWSFEFQWNEKVCRTSNTTSGDCPLLNLTSSQDNAAYVEFTMKKSKTDTRTAPLIVVWYDLLQVPYALRPDLTDTFQEFYFEELPPLPAFGLTDLWHTFKDAIIAAAVILALFTGVMILACVVGKNTKGRYDYILDTRGYRCTFKHTSDSLVIDMANIKSKSRFKCWKHGPWLVVVLVARIAYMFIYTFSFFTVVFITINSRPYNRLLGYPAFGQVRDAQILEFSANIEIYYRNETDRLSDAVNERELYCSKLWSNKTLEEKIRILQEQFDYHTNEMKEILANISINDTNTGAFSSVGPYGCNDNNGAFPVLTNLYLDPPTNSLGTNKYQIEGLIEVMQTNNQSVTTQNGTIYVVTNDTVQVDHTYYAKNYSTNDPVKFEEIKNILDARCGDTCAGWGFTNSYIDENNVTQPAFWQVYANLGSPILGVRDGICFEKGQNFSALFGDPSSFFNYTLDLQKQYELDYKSQIQSLWDTLTGLRDAINDLKNHDAKTNGFNYDVQWDNNPIGDYGVQPLYYGPQGCPVFSFEDERCLSKIVLNIACPGCPADGDNVTNPYLQDISSYLSNLNKTTLQETAQNVNASDLISLNTADLDFPELPSIELPNLKLDINLKFILSISFTLDGILMAYRWYKTAGMVAQIVRGRDVEIPKKYLLANSEGSSQVNCCSCEYKSCVDNCLDCIIKCYDNCSNLSYVFWKACYFIQVLFCLTVLTLIVICAYSLVDQIITVKFISQLGAFTLMTAPIGAQRSVRNQVIATTTLTYNNYTLRLMEDARVEYAKILNNQWYDDQGRELQRVDQWNQQFCQSWKIYQFSVKDVTTNSPYQSIYAEQNGNIIDENIINNVLDDNSLTNYLPNTTIGGSLIIELHLPKIDMGDNKDHYFVLLSLELSFKYNKPNSDPNCNISSCLPANFQVYTKAYNSTIYQQKIMSVSSYSGSTIAKANDIITSTFPGNDTQNEIETEYFRIIFTNVQNWGDKYLLNDIKLKGTASSKNFHCPSVTFVSGLNKSTPFYYEAYSFGVNQYCPQLTPVHGIMYRGFVRTSLNDQLIYYHTPYILALRNIALSPFYLISIGLGVLLIVYLVALIIQYFLMRMDLYRENPFTRVPLVTSRHDYDKKCHQTDELQALYQRVSSKKLKKMKTNSYQEAADGGVPGTTNMITNNTNVVSTSIEMNKKNGAKKYEMDDSDDGGFYDES